MTAICPSCRWPVRVTDGAIAAHPRLDTGLVCEGTGSVPDATPATATGQALVARLRSEAHAAAMRADDDAMHSHAREAARAVRDVYRILLRWVPEEIVRAEREAVEAETKESERLGALLEGVA